jgi:AcrR family transcriptional regulator
MTPAADTPTPSTTARRLMRREERQAQLLRAAAAAFARTGFNGTSMEDVAAEAGVTRLIVYRNFESKEELYRSVLEQVSGRLAEEFVEAMQHLDRRGWAARSLLAVAREDPDAFRLLWVHAVREPAFAAYAEDFRARAVELADAIIGASLPEPAQRQWATRMTVTYSVEAVLAWLDVGEPAEDEQFVERTTAGLVAMFTAWLPA